MPAPWDPLGWARQRLQGLQGVTPTQVMPRGGPVRGVAPQTVNVRATAVPVRVPAGGLRLLGAVGAAVELPSALRQAGSDVQALYEAAEGAVRGQPPLDIARRMRTPGYQPVRRIGSLPASARVPSQYPQGVPTGAGPRPAPAPPGRAPAPSLGPRPAPAPPGRATVPVPAPGAPARERAYRSAVQQGRAAAPPAPTLPAAGAALAASGTAPAASPGWTPEQIAAADARAAGKATRDPRSPDYWAQADIAAWASANKALADDLKRRVGYREPAGGGTYVDPSTLPRDLPAVADAPIRWQTAGAWSAPPSFTLSSAQPPSYTPGELLAPKTASAPPIAAIDQGGRWPAPTAEQLSPSFAVRETSMPSYRPEDLLRRRGIPSDAMYPIL